MSHKTETFEMPSTNGWLLTTNRDTDEREIDSYNFRAVTDGASPWRINFQDGYKPSFQRAFGAWMRTQYPELTWEAGVDLPIVTRSGEGYCQVMGVLTLIEEGLDSYYGYLEDRGILPPAELGGRE